MQSSYRTAHIIEQLKREEEIEKEEKERKTKERDQDKNHDDFYKLILEVVYNHIGIFCGNVDRLWYDVLGCRNQVVGLTGDNLEVMFYTGSDGNHLQWPRKQDNATHGSWVFKEFRIRWGRLFSGEEESAVSIPIPSPSPIHTHNILSLIHI